MSDPKKSSKPPSTARAAHHKARSARIAQALVDGLNRHTSSPEFLARHYRYENPKATDAEIEAMVARALERKAQGLPIDD